MLNRYNCQLPTKQFQISTQGEQVHTINMYKYIMQNTENKNVSDI